jgi:hypothetical protein
MNGPSTDQKSRYMDPVPKKRQNEDSTSGRPLTFPFEKMKGDVGSTINKTKKITYFENLENIVKKHNDEQRVVEVDNCCDRHMKYL